MNLSPSELKTVKRIAVNYSLVLIIVIGAIWCFRYFRFKQQNPDAHIDKSGHLVTGSDRIMPIDIEAHRLIAERLLATGQAERALVHLQRILELKPDNRAIRFQFARSCIDAGYFEKALNEFNRLDQTTIQDTFAPKIAALIEQLDSHGAQRTAIR